MFGDTVLAKYEYDELNRRVKGQYFDVKWDYTYDQYNQLVGAKNSTGDSYAYTYDPIGNRLKALENGKERNFTYNSLNQISSDDYAYDAWGNMTRTPEAEYKYDLKNRLVEVKKQDGTVVSYSYDPLAQRIGSVVNGSKVTEFLMSGMIEYARNDGKVQYHTLGLDLLGSLDKTGAVGGILATNDQPYLYDGNGNVIASEKEGKITDKLAYEPFGKQIAGKELAFTFSSKNADQIGLIYYGYRFYSPYFGKWMSKDLLVERGGLNIYAFVKSAIGEYDIFGLATVACTDNGIISTGSPYFTGLRMYVPVIYELLWGTYTMGVECNYQRIVTVQYTCPCSCRTSVESLK